MFIYLTMHTRLTFASYWTSRTGIFTTGLLRRRNRQVVGRIQIYWKNCEYMHVMKGRWSGKCQIWRCSSSRQPGAIPPIQQVTLPTASSPGIQGLFVTEALRPLRARAPGVAIKTLRYVPLKQFFIMDIPCLGCHWRWDRHGCS